MAYALPISFGLFCSFDYFFFFKQKTAYEILASDWSSDVCSSDLSALAACGASGVAGGSLLLIPLACSLFGISNDVAMQIVGDRKSVV